MFHTRSSWFWAKLGKNRRFSYLKKRFTLGSIEDRTEFEIQQIFQEGFLVFVEVKTYLTESGNFERLKYGIIPIMAPVQGLSILQFPFSVFLSENNSPLRSQTPKKGYQRYTISYSSFYVRSRPLALC